MIEARETSKFTVDEMARVLKVDQGSVLAYERGELIPEVVAVTMQRKFKAEIKLLEPLVQGLPSTGGTWFVGERSAPPYGDDKAAEDAANFDENIAYIGGVVGARNRELHVREAISSSVAGYLKRHATDRKITRRERYYLENTWFPIEPWFALTDDFWSGLLGFWRAQFEAQDSAQR